MNILKTLQKIVPNEKENQNGITYATGKVAGYNLFRDEILSKLPQVAEEMKDINKEAYAEGRKDRGEDLWQNFTEALIRDDGEFETFTESQWKALKKILYKETHEDIPDFKHSNITVESAKEEERQRVIDKIAELVEKELKTPRRNHNFCLYCDVYLNKDEVCACEVEVVRQQTIKLFINNLKK